MKRQSKLTRRHFIKTGLIWVPSAILIHDCMPSLLALSSVKSRTYSSVIDERIQLNNSHFAIPHGVATWNKLRIALRVSSTDTGGNLTGTPNFAVGLCAGTTNIYLDTTTTHFAGVKTAASSWSRGSAGALYYQAAGSSPYLHALTRIGSTTVTANLGTSSPFTINPEAATAAHRWLYFIDITKGSPNYTFNAFAASGAPSLDVSAADFLTYAVLDAPTVTGHAFAGTQTLAVDEATNGTLDSVNVHSDQAGLLIEISDLAVVRLS